MTLEDSFFLKGNKKTIVTQGCFKWIRTPAVDGADLQGVFQKSIRSAIKEAKDADIANPIVVGAIPFDPREPSALFIPRTWKSYDTPEEALRDSVGKDVPELTPGDITKSDFLGHDGFTKAVEDAVAEIRNGSLDKVVLSRLRTITTDKPLPTAALLARLIHQNPTGFTFHVPLPDKGHSRLSGTSPELLVRKSGTHFFSQPLAGSARRIVEEDDEIVKTLLNSPKDRYEHKLVIDSMEKTLKPRSGELNIPETPSCISTSKLWHLATSISGTVNDPNENVLSLACLLHPTPALSGFPHDKARELITKLEPFDREYFGGIVGYCDSNNDGEWYIAIRCGKLSDNAFTLFAGAGIVGDSIPESEWNETDVKLSTMMHVFNVA